MDERLEAKIEEINRIYAAFDAETASFRDEAACAKGCAYCCTEAGSVDITTLEGMILRAAVGRMPRARRTQVKKALTRDMKQREGGQKGPCAFLTKNRSCMIYDVRPFACRRVYSLHVCSGDNPPRLHRRAMARGTEAIRALQLLDDNGYSGHLADILHMLDAPRFLETYLAGEHRPAEIMAFGKSHGIVINKMVV